MFIFRLTFNFQEIDCVKKNAEIPRMESRHFFEVNYIFY